MRAASLVISTPALTLPRKTQYDQPVYMMMIGRRKTVPDDQNVCDLFEEAASQNVIVYGTIIGMMLMPRPR